MNKKFENQDFPFGNIDEIDEDGFINYQDIEDLHNTEFMENNEVFPPRGSYTNIPSNQFLLHDQDIDETIKAFKKLKEYDNPKNIK